MPSLHAILSVALAGFALSVTPGPSMLYVLSQTVGQSRMAGLASAVGLCLGGIALAIATALGLAAIFARFDWLVSALRYLGAAYLIWLGIGMIRTARQSARMGLDTNEVVHKPILSLMWQGVLVEVLNPKTVLFFALFLPPFVSVDQGSVDGLQVTLQLLVLGSLVPLTALPADILVAIMGSALTKTLRKNQVARAMLARTSGLLLIVIAVGLFWQDMWS
jgi:threonine/homoserine/homoserine lactone efflux protein